jgi:hypothetical protein
MKYKKEVTVSFLFNSIVLLSLSLFFLGCATVQIPVEVEVQHTYVLSVVDLDDNPLEGVTIEYDVIESKVVDSVITQSVKSKEDWEKKLSLVIHLSQQPMEN